MVVAVKLTVALRLMAPFAPFFFFQISVVNKKKREKAGGVHAHESISG